MENTERPYRVDCEGKVQGEKVFFGGLSKNTFPSQSPESIWITNTKGNNMTCAVAYDQALKFVNREGRKFRFATADEIPYVPEEKIYPFDPEKGLMAQEKANTTLTGREVAEKVNQGIDPLKEEKLPSYTEIRKMAKEEGLKVYGKKKRELIETLRDLGKL